MNIHIILPNKKSLDSAGVRIRYQRLQTFLPKPFTLELVIMDEVNEINKYSADFIIFCKCYDTTSITLAHQLKALGKQVAIDVFDDYFSEDKNTPQLAPIRTWFKQVIPLCNFVLCSTRKIESKLKKYFLIKNIHVLNDPYQPDDFQLAPNLIIQKASKAKRTKIINILWFGMGDNPHFSLGLDDLYHYLDFLHPINHNYKLHLTILTNQRALTLENLQKIQKISISFEVHEWSETLEKNYLKDSLICFLPTNHQSFSQAKSLNRAITALCFGNQVLSCGYPLYQPLDDFIYYHIDDIINDLDSNQLKLSKASYPSLKNLLENFASPKNEAIKFTNFLSNLSTQKVLPENPLIIIHGISSNLVDNKILQKSNVFSASLPFSLAPNYGDFYFFYHKIAKKWSLKLSTKVITYLNKIHPEQKIKALDWQTSIYNHLNQLPPYKPGNSSFDHIALYQPFSLCLKKCLTTLMPEARIITSESFNLLPEYCFDE